MLRYFALRLILRLSVHAFILCATVVAGFSLEGCRKGEGVGGVQKTQYRIGAILPLTGPIGYLGEQELVGLKLAIEDVNTLAKVNGFSLELLSEDFASQPANAVSAARKLIEVAKVDALFVSTTSATRAVAPIASAQNIPMLVISSDPAITTAAPVVFRVFMNSGVEQKILANRLTKLGIRSVYVLYNRDRAFESAFQELRDQLLKGDVRDIKSDTFEKTQTDFRIQILKAKSAKADAFVLLGFGSEFPLLLSQWGERSTGRFFGNYTFGTAGAHSQGLGLIEGIEFPTFATHNDSPQLKDFTKRALSMRDGKPLSDFMDHLYSYESVIFIEQCIKNSQATTAAGLISGCKAIKQFHGVSGIISMDESRNADIAMGMGVYRGGKLVGVE